MPFAFPFALALLTLADPPVPGPLDVASALEAATIQAIAKARPSVVAITRIKGDDPEKTTAIRGKNLDAPPNDPGQGNPLQTSPGDFALPGEFSAGVVIGEGGEILTTYHTLRGAERIFVRGGQQTFEAEILAADPRSDLAVIAPRTSPGGPSPKLPPIALGDASMFKPGKFLIALGNSYNAGRDGQASAALGILANTARKIHAPPEDGAPVRNQFFRYQPTLLQLDAKLNLGMSGGAVIDLKGELVGLTTAAASPVAYDVQAGYAIPMDALGRRIAETLREGKEVEYGFLGVALLDNVPNGISSVGPGTPADKADLLANDEIVAVGDRQLEPEDGLTMALSNIPAGQTVKLKVLRKGKVLDKTVLVSKYPVNGPVIATNRPAPWRGLRVDFTSVLIANGQAELMQAMSKGGVGVVEIETDSSSDSSGLRPGIVITEVDGKPVPTPADFALAVAAGEGKDVTLTTQLGPIAGQKVIVKP